MNLVSMDMIDRMGVNTMEVYDAVLSRLTVREFRSDSISDEVVHKLLEAGRLSPSSQNLQPWHFVVVRNGETIRRLGELATQGPFIGDAPMAIAIATDDTPRAQLDAGRALQQMELVAWEEGMGTCFVGIRQAEQNQAIKELLGIPDHLVLLTVLPFGYRKSVNMGRLGRRNRRSLEQVAHVERFGEAYTA